VVGMLEDLLEAYLQVVGMLEDLLEAYLQVVGMLEDLLEAYLQVVGQKVVVYHLLVFLGVVSEIFVHFQALFPYICLLVIKWIFNYIMKLDILIYSMKNMIICS
jgi:hypothetical protein